MDLIAAVVSYLNKNLTIQLGSAPGTPKAFADAAPRVNPPYVVVHDTDEHLEYLSDGSMIGSGHIYCVVKATGKAQARSIGLAIAQSLAAAGDAGLAIDEGTLLEFRPNSLSSAPLTEVMPVTNTAIAAERTVGFHYRLQYPAP